MTVVLKYESETRKGIKTKRVEKDIIKNGALCQLK